MPPVEDALQMTVYTGLTASYTAFLRFWRGHGHGNHGSGSGGGLLLGEVAVDALAGDEPPPAKLLAALKAPLKNPTPNRVLGHPKEGCRLNEGQSVCLTGLCHGSCLLRF